MNTCPTSPLPHGAPGTIVPRTAVLAGIAIGVVSLVILVPNRHEVFKRLLADGDADAAVSLLAEDVSGATVALTAETIRLCEKEGWNRSATKLLVDFLRHNRDFDSAAAEVLRQADRIPVGPRTEVLGAIVDRGLAEGRLEFAETVQSQLLDIAATLTPEMVRKAVTTFRYNNHPQRALAVIERFRATGADLPPELRDLRIELARETSQPDVAFALLKERIDATEDVNALLRLLPTAIAVGTEAGAIESLVPLYEKYLSLAESAAGDDRPRGVEAASIAMKLAEVCEWSGQASRAFDVYVGLVAEGNRKALERCIALNPGLLREEELVDALASGYQDFRHDDDLVLLTARLLANSARRDEAIAAYEEYLDRKPDDTEAWFQLGAICDEAGRHEEAFSHFQKARDLDGEHPANLKRLAASAAALGHYSAAQDALRALAETTGEAEPAVELYLLASSLGDQVSVKEALRLLIGVGGRQCAQFHLHLATAYRDEEEMEECATVLEEGVKRFPDNVFLRFELAKAYISLKRPEDALQTLKKVSLAEHAQRPGVVLEALDLLSATKGSLATAPYLRRFDGAFDGVPDLASRDLIILAELFRQDGQLQHARQLFRSIVAKSNDPGELARAHFHLGRVDEARRQQLRHLAAIPEATSADYNFLGDIYAAQGERTKARSAYQNALSHLKRKPPSP